AALADEKIFQQELAFTRLERARAVRAHDLGRVGRTLDLDYLVGDAAVGTVDRVFHGGCRTLDHPHNMPRAGRARSRRCFDLIMRSLSTDTTGNRWEAVGRLGAHFPVRRKVF